MPEIESRHALDTIPAMPPGFLLQKAWCVCKRNKTYYSRST